MRDRRESGTRAGRFDPQRIPDSRPRKGKTMDFIDFHLRAWQADTDHIQVLVHSSPVGSMERPVPVGVDLPRLDTVRRQFAAGCTYDQFTPGQIIALGDQLAAALLPPPVSTLLVRSLERIAPDEGLRLR